MKIFQKTLQKSRQVWLKEERPISIVMHGNE
jgi:hypothetical protein